MTLSVTSLRAHAARLTFERLSIRRLLLIVTAALTLTIALLAARDLYANAQRLNQAHELRSAIEVSDRLFDAAGAIAVERDLAVAMLQSDDPATIESLAPALAESRAAADASVGAARAALDAFEPPGLDELRGALDDRHARIHTLRPQLDVVLAAPRAARDPRVARLWEETATALMADIDQVWIGFIGPFTTIEPVVTQHLRYRQALRTITDYTGRERSIIGQILSQDAGPTPEQTADLLRAQGILEASWRSSRTVAEQSGLYPSIAGEFADAESHYATMADMTRDLFYVPGGDIVSFPIGPDLWFELSSQASDSLGALRQASRAATRRYLDEMISGLEGAILTQVLISLVALGLAAAGFWLVLSRVVRPIRQIVNALTRATRGEPVDFALSAPRNDEIGQLAGVLDAFQDKVEEIRRNAAALDASTRALEAEVGVRRVAEEKAQAQLERLHLLHRISRAIGERQDLNAIFDVVISNVEERLPADFACAFLYDHADRALKVACVGAVSATRAQAMDIVPGAEIAIDANGLSRCMNGKLVYEPELASSAFAFPQRLTRGGLKSFVAAPLQVESQVFGALIVARRQREAFSSAECEFLRQLSEHVALAVHQAQLNAALQQAYDDLRQTQEAAMQQERLRALGQMASGVAHDINNALSPIALYTESLLSTEPGISKEGRAKLEIVQRAIDDAARTIARMSEFYRKRDRELSLTPVDANTVVSQVLDLTQARWRDMPQQRGEVIEMRTDLENDLPSILGVESELREALTNLVFNAIDALPRGGGVVTLRTRREADAVTIEVQDGGVGMDEATRQRCLEPFFTTKGERGTGLGLAMVYGAIQRHGGDLAIESAVGEGTNVRLSFPAMAEAPAAAQSAPANARPLSRLRLLVVDDDPILLRSLRDVLESDGHVVAAFNDGNAAVGAFDTAMGQGGAHFDAVITDLGMPAMDGRRVAAAIKLASADTPVILLTGWGERLRAEEEMPPHIDCILSKPPKLADVRAALARLCAADVKRGAARV
jgi:signal transduction histidine kinase/ActR/RegA family two-component response regulator